MKAWKVNDIHDDFYSEVVFAETRGKAKSIAQCTDICEDSLYTDIRVIRVPELDKEYRGHDVMDWYDDEDKLALIQNGWHCDEVWPDECINCVGKMCCDTYTDYLFENNIKVSDIKYHNRRDNLIPYIDLMFGENREQIIKEIIIGPKCKARKSDIETFLAQNGIFCPIKKSDGTYR